MGTDVNRWVGVHRLRLKKGALLFVLYGVVLVLPYLLARLGTPWLRQQFGELWWLAPYSFLFILASAGPLVYVVFVRRMEARMLAEQRRYHRTLVNASKGLIRIKDIDQLCRLITYVVNRTVRLTHTGLLLFDPKENRFVLRAVRHRSMLPVQLDVETTDPVIHVLREWRDLVALEDLAPEGETKTGEEPSRHAQVYAWMRKLEAKLLVPSFSGDRLLGFLVLGGKRSGEAFIEDDQQLFAGLANQAALAVENAMVFDELRSNEGNMIQSEKLASLGQLASGMAHEIHNPLTIISGEAQLFLARFRGKDEKVDEMLTSIIEECHRAADITRRILRFAKPAPVVNRLADMPAVDLRASLEDSLTLAGYQVRLERVERKIDIPEALPKVRCNQTQLQEVLLNLILNACQAMGDAGGTLTFTASTSLGRQVELRVEDTGPGIAPNKLKKVFDPFFTTKQAGTGLGLFVCQRIIQSHGGVIEVTSVPGQGTCFTVRLPSHHEAEAPADAPKA